MKIWNLGYPRIGRRRELKKGLESFWSGESSEAILLSVARKLREARWVRQHELGVESIPVNDFSLYDPILDMVHLLGAIPKRFEDLSSKSPLQRYFAMARGYQDSATSIAALDMTKWFNTNYHYLVPELDRETTFKVQPDKLFEELDHCRTLPYTFHPVLIGPWTFAKLAKCSAVKPAEILQALVGPYREILRELKARKFEWVQIDEPCLCQDLSKDEIKLARQMYEKLTTDRPFLCLTTYFEAPEPWLSEVSNFPVEGIHFDLVHGRSTLHWLKTKAFPQKKILSLGVLNGRNIWAASLCDVVKTIQEVKEAYQGPLWVAPSCSLVHMPHDKRLEKKWDAEFLAWVSFADQRLEELTLLKKALEEDKQSMLLMEERDQSLRRKLTSRRIHRSDVKQAVERINARMKSRKSPFAKRIKRQMERLKLPLLPSTTIGSFPQTRIIRHTRQDWKQKRISDQEYQNFLRKEIESVVRLQEKLGLDVLVHGEPERNDMVEYFGEQLEGFTFSEHAWVQSYGSRCVKPPLIYGDVKRKAPMTIQWYRCAQELTARPVKGMLTGPVTILNWSFVREDQSREKTAFQIALAIRDEVRDLEKAGAKIIQIDEAAIREGLPIKRQHWGKYLQWAVDSFRVCASVAEDETQIQTHMCYSEFSDIMEAIVKLDADVLLIEFARSGPTFFETFKKTPYPNQIGPGIYDIHSPRVPGAKEMEDSIWRLLKVFPAERLWINPDCGLKTRKREEVEPALSNMVESAKRVRGQIASSKGFQRSHHTQTTSQLP